MRFYLETYGCKLNQADSQLIRKFLRKSFKEESSPKRADFVVINSCGVIEKTEKKILKRIKELKNQGKKIILAGCLPLISPEISKIVELSFGPREIFFLEKEIKRKLIKKEIKLTCKRKNFDKAKFFKKLNFLSSKESSSAILAISEGCLGDCSYCATKFARGKLTSFSEKNITESIKFLLKKNFKEIQLTSQDIAIYGRDKKTTLANLLAKILKIKADFKIKLGMANPGNFKIIFKQILPLLFSEKIYKFWHLPFQSGSDRILKKMKRNYKIKDFLEISEKLKKFFPESVICTDIIVGFPGEKEKDFKETIKIIKEIKPTILNITKFSARRNTEASAFKDQVPEQIKSKRSKIIFNLWKKIREKENRKFLGKEIEVLIIKKGKNNSFLAREKNSGRAVILKNGNLGETKKVKIIDFRLNYLIGKM